jgi:DNA-directed RNA polymerase subunit beta'
MLLSKGIKQRDLVRLVEDAQYIVLDPKDSGLAKYDLLTADELEELVDIEDKEFEYATGSDALGKLLSDVNLDEELRLAESNLKNAKTATDRSKAHKHVRVLSSALDNEYAPMDYMLPFVPVLPVKYREPVKANADDRIAEDGITLLYQNLMKKNQEIERTYEKYEGNVDMMDKKTLAEIEADRYKTVKFIMGVGPKFNDKTKGIEYEGILHRLSEKEGFIREKMQKKLQDYSGRSVIVVDPELDMDQAGIPEDMASEIFAPKIERELQKDKYTPREIMKIMKDRDEPFRRALTRVAENEVVILNRQPSLHRHSLQAFNPVIRWDGEKTTNRAIGLNPLVTTAFNADFDGDTMAVHVPITDAARKEAKEKLMPSQNLLNPTNNSIITDLKHEMQLGLYYMTRDRMPEGMPKDFKDVKELLKAYEKGEVTTYQSVKMNVPMKGMVTSTVGRHLFNSVLPPAYIDYDKNVNMKKKPIEKILSDIMADPKYGPMTAVNIINQWKNLGFRSSTNSGISIGVKDFDNVASIDKAELFNEAEKSLGVANFIDKRHEFEEKKMEYVENRIKGIINSGVLGADNPVEIMRASGARGNAGQILSMSAVVGRGKNVSSESIRPVKSSLLEGTTPDEFWDLSNDSRKGIFDRSVASQRPGELTRYVWLSNKQTMISQKDCGDTQGITLNLANPSDAKSLHGRILLADVPLKKGGLIKAKKGTPLTAQEIEKIKTEAVDPAHIHIRSPLSCKVSEGLCQYCYGAKPGTMQNQLVPIGEPVGSIAAQAIGEPSQQAIMKTFHTGAGQSNTANSFEQINNVLSLTDNLPNKAVVVEKAGAVKNIVHDVITGTVIIIGAKKYNIGHRPLSDSIKIGVNVEAGDSLTREFDANMKPVTVRSATDVLKYQGLDATREHLTHQLDLAFESGDINNIDRRHMEVVVNNMANRAIVQDGGSTPFITEQRAPIKTLMSLNDSNSRVTEASLDYGNRMNVVGSVSAVDYFEGIGGRTPIVAKGEVITEQAWDKLRMRRKFVKIRKEKVTFTPELQNVKADSKIMNNNWLEHASRGNTRNVIGQGAGMFMEDKLDNPLTRQMTGLKGNFADGFVDWASDMKDRFGDLFV